MRKLIWLVLAVLLAASAVAQEPKGPPPPDLDAAYKIDYTISEFEDGKKVNTRTYTVMTDDGGDGRMNLGMRVPIQMGDKGIQYMDVGLRIGSKVRPRDGNHVWLSTRFEISGLIEQATTSAGAPTLRTMEYSVPTVVALGKNTPLAVGDDLASRKRFQLEATVTKVR